MASAISFALLSLLDFSSILGSDIDGKAGGFLAIVSAKTKVPTIPTNTTPIFHNAMPPKVAEIANLPVRSDMFTGLFKQQINMLSPSMPCPVETYPSA